jgi:MATE family multidrug resistance protein
MMRNHYRTYLPYVLSILKLSVPLIIGQLGFVLMGVADTVMVGHVSADALAAAGVSNAVFFLIMVICIGTGTVISPMIAKSNSAGEPDEIKLIYNNGLLVHLILGVVLTAIVALLAYNFHWFKQPPGVEKLSIEYTLILSLTSLPFALFFFLKQISDGLSKTTWSMAVTVAGLLMNVLLNWVLIYGKWGFPALGLNGAGIATLITRVFMAVAMWAVLWYVPEFSALIRRKVSHFYEHNYFVNILKVGLPAGMQYFFEIGAFSGSAFLIGWLGTYQLAAHNVAINLASVTYMIVSGISIAASIKVGDALGQHKWKKVRKTGISAIYCGLSFMTVFAVLFLLFDKQLVALYTNEPEVIRYATGLVIIAGFFQLFDGTQAIGLGILRGVSDVNIPTFVTLLAYWGIGLPLGYYLAFVQNFDVYGIWMALLLGLFMAALLHTLRFLHLTGKRIREKV